MTRLALTALATAAAYAAGWCAATAWWGRCATGCRRGAPGGAGPVSVGAPRLQAGAERHVWDRPTEADFTAARAAHDAGQLARATHQASEDRVNGMESVRDLLDGRSA